jgi:catechol 2,3-dioxygenase-like lactoylglutathione lyase family enzyme
LGCEKWDVKAHTSNLSLPIAQIKDGGTMSVFKGPAHIGIHTRDMERSKAFYIENLGFKLEHEARLEKPGNQWVNLSFLRLGSMLVELIEPSDKTKAGQGQGGSINHIAVEVKGIGDTVKTLKEKGIEMETEQPNSIPHLFNGVKTAFFKGPSGERIELVEYTEV